MKEKLEKIRNLLNSASLENDLRAEIATEFEYIENELLSQSHTELLVELTQELGKLSKTEEIIAYVAKKLYEFWQHEHAVIFFSFFNSDEDFLEMNSLFGSETIIRKARQLFDNQKMPDKLTVSPGQKDLIHANKLIKLPSIKTVLMDSITLDDAIELQDYLGVSYFYGYGFSDGTSILSTFNFASDEEINKSTLHIFESTLNLLNSILVHKAENDKIAKLYYHLTRILDISNYVFGVFNKNGSFLTGNEGFKKFFNVIPDAALNLLHKVFYSEIGLQVSEIDDIKKGYSINLNPQTFSELFGLKKRSFSSGNITPVISEDNEVEYYILFLISDKEDNRLLKSMQLQEEKYQRIFNHIQDVYFEIGINGEILEISPSIERYLGVPREYLISRNIIEFYNDINDRQKYLEELYKNGSVKAYHLDLKDLKGNIVHCVTTATIVDLGLESERIIGSLTDFTEQYEILAKVRESESKLRALFDNSPLGILISNKEGKIIDVNKRFLQILGSPSKEDTQKLNILSLDSIVKSGIAEKIINCVSKKENITIETVYHSIWGKELYIKLFINPILDDAGDTHFIVLFAEDLSAIRAIDDKLKETRERLRDIYEKTNDLIYTMDFDGNFTSVNPIAEKWLGFKYNELQNKNMRQFISLDSSKRAAEATKRKLSGETDQTSYEIEAYNRSGVKMILEVNSFLRYKDDIPIEVFGIARDITERKLHEHFIQSSLLEKEALYKEMHHRVKNNLQMILSLLKMHQNKFGDSPIKHAFNDVSQKILAISAVHEDFYFSKGFKEIPFKNYLETIMLNALDNCEYQIQVNYRLDIGNISTDIDTAIPVGLIVSELINNSIHHAFAPNSNNNEIRISMSSIGEVLTLIYYDNGCGFDTSLIYQNDKSSGLQLIKMLAESQLDGNLHISSNSNGTEVKIEFSTRKN